MPRVSQCLASLEASRLSMPRVSRSLASLDASRLSMHRVSTTKNGVHYALFIKKRQHFLKTE